MTDRLPFLAAIRDHHDDDAPRLVYADWLDERGESDYAEFIRVQCELASRYPDDIHFHSCDTQYYRLQGRAADLLAAGHVVWPGFAEFKAENWLCSSVLPAAATTWTGFGYHVLCLRRGFVESVSSTKEWRDANESALRVWHPVQKWDVSKTFTQSLIESANAFRRRLGRNLERLILSPQQAEELGRSAEIRDLLVQSPIAHTDMVMGQGRNSWFGLPDRLYGIELIVEDRPLS